MIACLPLWLTIPGAIVFGGLIVGVVIDAILGWLSVTKPYLFR